MAQENIFQSLLDNLQHYLSDIEGGESEIKLSDVFLLQNFWLKLCLSTKCIHSETTKLCLLFSKSSQLSTKDTSDILRTVEVSHAELVDTFYTLPKEHGMTFRAMVQQAVIKVTKALFTLIKSLAMGAREEKELLLLTGWVWEACDAMEVLPRDSLEAISQLIERELGLVEDAVQELEEEVKSEHSEEDDLECWRNQDADLLPPCLGLVKVARACIRRTSRCVAARGKSDAGQCTAQLDDLSAVVVRLSPVVDDFVSSVYAPMEREALKSTATELMKEVRSLLLLTRQAHYTHQDQDWVDFLLRALDHNSEKLQLQL